MTALTSSPSTLSLLKERNKSEIELNIEEKLISGRFTALLNASKGRPAACDLPLYENAEWVVAPTLGAIVPDWVIVVPRDYALSFRNWQKLRDITPEVIVDELCDHLGLRPKDVIWFEHGPNALGSSIGCGADHAHIHMVLKPSFSFQTFLNEAISRSALDWTHAAAKHAYASLPDEGSYLVTGSGDVAAWTTNVEATGSQFFRRVIGSLSGQPEQWDYKRFSHEQNIAQTIETFRTLEGAARRGR